MFEALKKGYECIKILIAICLNRLKGLMIYNEGVALNRKIVFPLFRTIKVWREKEEGEKKRGKYVSYIYLSLW